MTAYLAQLILSENGTTINIFSAKCTRKPHVFHDLFSFHFHHGYWSSFTPSSFHFSTFSKAFFDLISLDNSSSSVINNAVLRWTLMQSHLYKKSFLEPFTLTQLQIFLNVDLGNLINHFSILSFLKARHIKQKNSIKSFLWIC